MRKLFFLLSIAFLLFSGSALAADQSYYVSSNGAGSHNGTDGNEWSKTEFSTASNWSATEDAAKIDPGDTVNFEGTFTTTWLDAPLYIRGSGTEGNPITFDGYAGGDCDTETACSGSAVFDGAHFSSINNSYLVFRDFVFQNQASVNCGNDFNPSCSFISIGRGESTDDTSKQSHITITNNKFNPGRRDYGSSIGLGFVTDYEVSSNYFKGDGVCGYPDPYVHTGSGEDFIGITPGGARGKIINNHVVDSYHLVYNVVSTDRNSNGTIDFPSSGSYAKDPEAHPQGVEIAYNLFDGWCEEGISFDDPSGSYINGTVGWNIIEADTISAKDDGANTITLDNFGGEWTGLGNKYSGLYLFNVKGVEARYGRIALIEVQADNVMTIADADMDYFSVGDSIGIGLINTDIWIHHNRIGVFGEGNTRGWGPIWTEGTFFNSLIENNWNEEYVGGSDGSAQILIQSVSNNFYTTNGVTQTTTSSPSAFNLIRNNTTERLQGTRYSLFNEGGLDEPGYNNSYINNRLHETGDTKNELSLSKTYSYYIGNTYIDSGDPINVVVTGAGGLQTSDATTGVPVAIYAQSHITPNIISTSINGSTLYIDFTENVSGCSSGNCGFTITDDGGATYPTLTYVSGNTTSNWSFTIANGPLDTNAYLFYTPGVLVDDDALPMYEFSIVGHSLETMSQTSTFYTVTQDGSGVDYSVSAFNALTGDKSDIRYYFSGDITSEITPQIYGTAGHPVILDGYQASDSVDVVGGDSYASFATVTRTQGLTEYALHLTGVQYITIQDFEFTGGRDVVLVNGSAHDINFYRCAIHDSWFRGIALAGATHPTSPYNIVIGGSEGNGCRIFDIGVGTAGADIELLNSAHDVNISYNMLYATKSTGASTDRGIDGVVVNNASYDVLVEYNAIFSHQDLYSSDAAYSGCGADCGGYGEDGLDIKTDYLSTVGSETWDRTRNVVVRFNDIYDNYKAGVQIQTGAKNITVYGNSISGNGDGDNGGIIIYEGNGVYTQPPEDIAVFANLVYDNDEGGVLVINSENNVVPTNIAIFNNTIAVNSTGPTDSSYTNIKSGPVTGTSFIKNNAIYKGRPLLTDYRQIYLIDGNWDLDYNLYRWPSQTSQSYVNSSSGDSIDYEDNEQIADSTSVFTDEDNNDYTPSVGSLLIDRGDDLSTFAITPVVVISKTVSPAASYMLGATSVFSKDGSLPSVVNSEQSGSWEIGAYAGSTGASSNIYYLGQDGTSTKANASAASGGACDNGNTHYMSVATHNASTFAPGDTIYLCVEGGDITDEIHVPSSGSAIDGYITYDGLPSGNYNAWGEGADGQATVSRSQSADQYCFHLWNSADGVGTGKDYIIIQDVEMEQFSNAVAVASGSDHIIVRRNFLHDGNGHGFNFTTDSVPGSYLGCSYITVGGSAGNGNVVKDVGIDTAGSDVNISTSNNFIVSYNHLYATKNTGADTDRGIDGITPLNGTYNGLIEYNVIHSHNDSYGADAFGEDGIDIKDDNDINPTHDIIIRFNNIYDHIHQSNITLQTGTYNIVVYGNRLDGAEWAGILLNEGTGVTTYKVHNVWAWANLITNHEQTGIELAPRSHYTMENIYLWNNTLANNGNLPEASENVTNLYTVSYATGNVLFKNNILYKGRPDDDNYKQIYHYLGTELHLDYNIYRWPSQASVIDYSGSTNTPGTFDPHAIMMDDTTIFTDEDADDFTLKTSSPAEGAGYDLSTEIITPTISVQGTAYTFEDTFVLDSTTDFTEGQIPVIVSQTQPRWDWHIGAYGPTSNPTKYYISQSGAGDGTAVGTPDSVADFNSGALGELDDKIVYFCGEITSSIIVPDSGTDGHYVTINGDCSSEGGTDATLTTAPSDGGIQVTSKSYINIKNFVIDADYIIGTDTHYGIYLWGNDASPTHHILIDGNDISECGNGVIGHGTTQYVTITNNAFHALNESGVIATNIVSTAYRPSYWTIGGSAGNGNTFVNVGYADASNDSDAMIWTDQLTNLIVSHNYGYGSGTAGEGWGMTGIYSNATYYALVEYNIFHDLKANNNRGLITFKNDQIPCSNTGPLVIRFNHVYNNYAQDESWGQMAEGIYASTATDGYYVYGNYVHNVGTGIAAMIQYNIAGGCGGSTFSNDGYDTKNVYIFSNLVADTQAGAIAMQGEANISHDSIDNVWIFNNTLYKTSNQDWTLWAGLSAGYQTGYDEDGAIAHMITGAQMSNHHYFNNIFQQTRPNNVDYISMLIRSSMTNTTMGDNLFYDSRTSSIIVREEDESGANTDLLWNSGSRHYYTGGSAVANPNMAAPASGNFALTVNSTAAISTGTDMGTGNIVSLNIHGRSVNVPWDFALGPNTVWSATDPDAIVIDDTYSRDDKGDWDKGAYYYPGTVTPISTYHVAQTATGDGSGSSTLNYMSVATHNSSIFLPGDIIYLYGNISTPVVPPSSGSLAGGYITYDGLYAGNYDAINDTGGSPAIIDTNHTDSYGGFYINQKSYIIVQDLKVNDCNSGIRMSDNNDPPTKLYSDHLIVRRNLLANNQHNGIAAHYIDYFNFENNWSHNNRQGLAEQCNNFTGILDGIIRGNKFTWVSGGSSGSGSNQIEVHECDGMLWEYNDIANGPDQSGIAFKEYGNQNIIFRFNKVHDNPGRDGWEGVGVSIGWPSTTNFNVYCNAVYDNGSDTSGYGISTHDSTTGVNIWSNVLWNNGHNGIQNWYQVDRLDPNILGENPPWGYADEHYTKDLKIQNNSIYGVAYHETSWINPGQSGLVNNEGNTDTGNHWKNNIVKDSRINATAGYQNQLYQGATNWTIDWNRYDLTGGGETFYYPQQDFGGAQRNFSTWQGYGYDGHGDTDDPGFNDPDNGNLTLNGSKINDGADLRGLAATVEVQGQTYYLYWQTALMPTTDWSQFPSSTSIITGDQTAYDSFERGAYIYVPGGLFVTESGAGDGTGSSLANAASAATFTAGTGAFADLDGDTVYMCGEITTGLKIPDGGTSSAHVTINFDCSSQGGTDGSLTGTGFGGSQLYANLAADSKDYIDILNATIDQGYTSQMTDTLSPTSGMRFDSCNHIWVDNATITQTPNGIMFLYDGTYFTLTRSTLSMISESGVFVGNVSSAVPSHIVIGGSLENGNTFENITYKTAVYNNTVGYDVRISSDQYTRIDDVVVSYNEMSANVTNRGMSGLQLINVTNALVEYNEIHGHRSYYNRPPISIKGADWPGHICENIVLRFNKIYDANVYGVPYGLDEPVRCPDHYFTANITVSGNYNNIYIYGNYLYDGQGGIDLNLGNWGSPDTDADTVDALEVHVWGNVIMNMYEFGIKVDASDGVGDEFTGLSITNNTIYNVAINPCYLFERFAGIGIGLGLNNITNAEVKNNVIFDSRESITPEYSFYTKDWSDTDIKNNFLEQSDSAAPMIYYANSLFTPGTILSINTAYSENFLTGDSGFTNPSIEDFGLDADSDLIEAGLTVEGPFNIPAAVVTLSGTFSHATALDPDTDLTAHPWTWEAVARTGIWDIGAIPYGGSESSDTTAPTIQSIFIGGNPGIFMVINFSEYAKRGANWVANEVMIDCSISGQNIPITYISGDNVQWLFFSSIPAVYGDVCYFNFDENGTGNVIEDLAGNDLAPIIGTSLPITNTVPPDPTYLDGIVSFGQGVTAEGINKIGQGVDLTTVNKIGQGISLTK